MESKADPTIALSRRSLADQVADALVELILSEGLKEGDSLPSTAELSERFRVSRTVVREALAALAGRGILARSQGRESVVATPGSEDLTRLLQFRIRRDEVGVQHILDTRLALEVMSASLAAQNGTAEHKREIRLRLDELAASQKETKYHQADIKLHRSIAVASGNPLLTLILDALEDFLLDVRVKATKARKARGESLEPAIEQHRKIVAAIEAGNVERASETMRDHLEMTRAELS